jgi:diaminopimelate epimerase
MARYQYQIFIPGGNKTALVLSVDGLSNDKVLRKAIQDKILTRHESDADGEVEQVGFVSGGGSAPALIMTGGEFCGNATRSAAAYFCREMNCEELTIQVSGTVNPIKAGCSSRGTQLEAWAEIPLSIGLSPVCIALSDGLYWVPIEGISHLIVPQAQAAPYLEKFLSCESKAALINIAIELLKKTITENSLSVDKAYGVIFLENSKDVLKMHPFVHVVSADTTYYETACGSGAACVGLVTSFLKGESISLPLLQPSGKIIRAEVKCSDKGVVKKGRISGEILIGETGELEC